MKKITHFLLVMVFFFAAMISFSSEVYASEGKVCYTQGEVVEYVRQCAVEREEKVTVTYTTPYMIDQEELEEITDKVLWEQTESPKEGDYLAFHYAGYNCSLRGAYVNGMYEQTITYNFEYHTSKEQEEQVDKKVEEVLEYLEIDEGMHDYTKAMLIYDYICDNVKYRDAEGDGRLDATAYSALIEGEAICQGYANLFYRLAREAGLDARVVTGLGNGEPHAWNIVKIEGKYYCLDATWDMNLANPGYFLKGSDEFYLDHQTDKEYSGRDFSEEYKISKGNYQHEGSTLNDVWMPKAKIYLKEFTALIRELKDKIFN